MGKTQFVKAYFAKDDVNTVFLVKNILVNQSRDGKKYLNIILADKSGEMEARKWQGAEEVAATVKKGDYVSVVGKVNQFQSRLQIIISSISKVSEEDIELSDFIVTSQNAPEKMFDELLLIVEEIKDVYIKDLVKNVLSDYEISRRIKKWQAGKTIHHAFQGGLLEHLLSCTQAGIFLSKLYRVNESYVIAGTILHDLCKVYELTDGANVEYTEEGKLVGHLVKGVELIDRFSRGIKNFPYSMKLHLKHIIISHHGEYEYGSPKIPQTKEAYLVHLIDLMDSKMGSINEVIRTDNTPGHWSSYIRHMDRIIYKDELPTFTEYISDEKADETLLPKKEVKKHHKEKNDKPLKNSAMASLLKDFKVDE